MGEETPVLVKQEEAMTFSPDSRLPKKPRTGDNASNGSCIANDPSSTSQLETRVDQDSSPISGRTLTESSRLAAQRARQRADPAPSAPQSADLASYKVPGSFHTRLKPPAPSEIRQQRVYALNSLHSAHRSMVHPVTSDGPVSQRSIMAEPRVPIDLILFGARTSLSSRSEGILHSATPETHVVLQVSALPGARST